MSAGCFFDLSSHQKQIYTPPNLNAEFDRQYSPRSQQHIPQSFGG